jgi:hypothetical protein
MGVYRRALREHVVGPALRSGVEKFGGLMFGGLVA